ncbi:hypothetical protein LTR70_000525 [Exophiala xenobiotica]|uniref:Uncharacterized protein n=1 Tax=Lithohypha guttulata TaxID=1690604 RepID=A0ABR0KBD4_9EURO|nr:hypothetical protein LTR24_004667 [Lithohypha guttulata]KAK5329376.1 hypothetical protein LTR70_000525 [Exophiala xenobiotica]
MAELCLGESDGLTPILDQHSQAEIARLNREMETLKQENERLHADLAEARARLVNVTPPAPPTPSGAEDGNSVWRQYMQMTSPSVAMGPVEEALGRAIGQSDLLEIRVGAGRRITYIANLAPTAESTLPPR